jgi:UDP-N-acetyl-D-glucosamine dehydrogenase
VAFTLSERTAEFKQQVEAREVRIGIVGMGYVGLPLALLFSEERFKVTGFDIDSRKVNTLNQGGSYIMRIPGTEIQQAQQSGFRATADYSEDVVIICVPTPLDEYHEPDLSYVSGTVRSIAPHVHESQLVILESTTYPRTTEEIVVLLLEQGIWRASRLRATRQAADSTWRFHRSGKIPATTRLRAAIFPRLWAVADRWRLSFRPLFTRPSLTAPFRSPRLRRQR